MFPPFPLAGDGARQSGHGGPGSSSRLVVIVIVIVGS
jgi:hypothetical protein